MPKNALKIIGPGILVAATGVGAGDMVAAAVAGAQFGLPCLWAVVLGAILKYVLNEGLGRFQLASGKSFIEGQLRYLGAPCRYYFVTYLFIWAFVVGAALISACGLAAHALFPQLSVATWGILHSLLGIFIVFAGGQVLFEGLMKFFVGMMTLTLLGCALSIESPIHVFMDFWRAPLPPLHSGPLLLGVLGGVGGSLTLLSYGHWMRAQNIVDPERLPYVRLDLKVAYILTGVFGVALIILATYTLKEGGVLVSGTQGVIQMAHMLEVPLGKTGKYIFICGLWGAVFTSLLGVWESVPALFCEYRDHLPNANTQLQKKWVKRIDYRLFLFYLAGPPMVLLFIDKPVFIIVLYAIVGSLFMPYLAFALWKLNEPPYIPEAFGNTKPQKAALLLLFLIFLGLCIKSLVGLVAKYV